MLNVKNTTASPDQKTTLIRYQINEARSMFDVTNLSASTSEDNFVSVTYPNIIERRFNRLAKSWRHETAGMSSITDKSMNLNYQKIIGLGVDVVPYILKELETKPDHWLWALESIVDEDENPITPDVANSFKKTIEAWIRYGKSKNYL